MEEKSAATRVTVLDEAFAIRSTAPPEYTRRVAAHVDATLRSLRKSSPSLEPFTHAVLGAMEITDELFRAREEFGTAAEEAVQWIDGLSRSIDRALERSVPTEDEEVGTREER